MIKVLLDQNIPAPIETWLQSEVGSAVEITSTRTLSLQRITDEELFHFCQQQEMILVTYDEDFQNPLVISNIPGVGVVRLNIYPTGFRQTQEALQRLLKKTTQLKVGRKHRLWWTHTRFVTKRNRRSRKRKGLYPIPLILTLQSSPTSL